MQLKCLLLSALVFQLTITACKSRDAETSKLWSIRTGEDFVRLLTLGRSVAEHNQAQGQGSSLALTKGASSYGGVAAADAVWEPVDDTLIHARFDTTKTPAIPPSKLPAEALSIVNTMASALGVKPSELQPMPSLSLSDPSLIDQNRLDQNIAAQTASPKSAASQVSDAYITVLGDWTTVHFARVISSIPVRDARIDVSFAKREGSWHLAEITNRGWGKSPEAGSEQTSLLSLTDLASVTGMKDLKILKTGAQYIPVKDSQKATTLRRSNWYYVVGPDGLAYTLTFSGAEEPILVEAFSNRYDAIVQAESFATSWANSSRVFVPLVGASYSTGGAKQTLDDSGGLSTVDPGGSIQLSGKIARVRSQQSGSTNLAVKKNGDGWIVHVDDSNRSEVNAYTAIVRIRGLAQQHLSDANTGYFRKTLDVTTRISGKCNAYYQSRTLKFFQQNEGCADMATVNDVVMHEWGHGLDDHTGPGQTGGGGITDGAFSEGIGDIVAFTYSGQNKMAMGFFTNDPTKYLRNAVNTLRYNGTQMEIHKEGTIIGGAFWELRRRLINKYGESTGARRGAELFFKHLAFADNYQASYNIVQRLADDDNNPSTRHPDYCIVNHAFSVKGLANEESCTDDYDSGNSIPTQSADEVFLAVVGDDNGLPIFESSTINSSVAAIHVCKSTACQTPDLILTYKSARADRRIFGTTKGLPVTGGSTILLQAVDANGKVLASRRILIKQK